MVHASGFHHVALTVRDCDVSAAWYQQVLGLTELFREDGDERRACVMAFRDGGFAVGVVEHRGADGAPFDARRTGLDHLAFTVSTRAGLDAWVVRLDEHAVDHSAIVDLGERAIVNAKDPDGIACRSSGTPTRPARSRRGVDRHT
jgi:glyoxylase I family protein